MRAEKSVKSVEGINVAEQGERHLFSIYRLFLRICYFPQIFFQDFKELVLIALLLLSGLYIQHPLMGVGNFSYKLSEMVPLKKKLSTLDDRSKKAYKNVVGSVALKGISMVVSLLLVPLTIEYVSPDKYGIWLTLSSIVSWLGFFDIGLSNGTKNKVTESLAKNDSIAAREYVSTSYFVIGFIFLLVFALFYVVNQWLDWSNIMSVDSSLKVELSEVMLIVVGLFCVSMILNVINSVISAIQKPAISSLITTTGQVFVLIAIAYFVYQAAAPGEGSLKTLALCLSGIPCIVTLVFSFFLYMGKYKSLSPTFKCYNGKYISDVLNLGWKFFVIQASLILVFQISNLVIIRETDSMAVTQYNIAYKYFMISHMLFNIVLTPFWAAFTDAYIKQDYAWMRATYFQLSKCWILFSVLVAVMLFASPIAYNLWIGKQVEIPVMLSVFMSVFVILNSRAGFYMTLINGTGKVFLQMIVYVVISIVSVPLMILSAKLFGVVGVVLTLTISVAILSIFGHLQLNKIINKKDFGIWSK